MSTKSTIFLSDDNEHLYHEHISEYNEYGHVVIEIDSSNIHKATIDKFGDIIIELKNDCDLSKWLKSKQP